MRWLVANVFKENFQSISRSEIIKTIAVVGGYESDIEIQTIIELNPYTNIRYFGIDNDSRIEFLDLNSVDSESLDHDFDLFLCSQVIEHIWNFNNFFKVINRLTKKGGYVWISCPFSNIAHGSPEYYAAGYTPEMLINNLGAEKWETIIATQFGSKRDYVSTHLYAKWLSRKELFHPILGYQFKPGSLKGVLWKLAREMPGNLHLSLLSNSINSNTRWATETVLFIRKCG
jgi:SAM-dependent methyltransferase